MDDRNYTFILNELVPDHLNYFEKGGEVSEEPKHEDCIDEDHYDDRHPQKPDLLAVDRPAPINYV